MVAFKSIELMAKPVGSKDYRHMTWNPVKQMLIFILLIVLSWVAIHILAVLGVFIIVAYPLWVLLNPHKETCFFCMLNGGKEGCFLCKGNAVEEGRVKHSFREFLFNILLLIFLVGVSIGVVWAEKLLLENLEILSPEKTIVMEIPLSNEYRIGELFTMPVEMHGLEVPINTVQIDLKYPSELVEIADILTMDSFAEIFLQKEIRNDLGIARISGGLPSPGYSKESGLFCKILFLAKGSGLGEIEILPTSMILANDGNASNVLAEFSSSAFLISDKRISKAEEEFQSTILQSKVLGVFDDKMTFFEEDSQPAILESLLEDSEIEVKEIYRFWDLLHSIDKRIIEIASRIFRS